MVNGIVSLISLSELVLLVYRNARNLCINFVSCNFTGFSDAPVVFWQHLWNSLCLVPCHLQMLTALLAFQFGFLFYFLSSLIAKARSSKTMLNKSGKIDIFVLFLILEEKLSAFHC